MRVRIQNRMGTYVEVPRIDGSKYVYHDFYLDRSNRLICKNVLGRQWPIDPPYTIHRHFFGTNEDSVKEVL